jgi:hypothetical protein
MKQALRKVHAEHADKRGKIRASSKQTLANVKATRNHELGKLDAEYEQRSASIRAEFDAKASERLLKAKVADAAA